MIETRHTLSKFSPTGKVFDRMVTPIKPPGPYVYYTASAEDIGYPDRQDNNTELSPSEINKGIFNEGFRLAGADVLDIGDGKEILVFNTSVASTHTLLTVKYDEWEQSFREQANNLGYKTSDGILIHGRNSNNEYVEAPTHVPLDMVTWTMVRNKETQTYWPCDINDLTSLKTGNDDIDQFKLELNDDKLMAFNELLVRRNKLAINTILDLHNNILCKKIPSFRQKTKEDLLIGALSGYHRGDEAKNLDQFEYDHRGKGPMSNPTFHFRITDHFNTDDAKLLDPDILSEQYPDYFKNSVSFLHLKPEKDSDKSISEVLSELMLDSRFSPFDLIKSVDPFGSLAQEYLGEWLQGNLSEIFKEIPHVASLFTDHTADYESQFRVSEGVTINFGQSLFEENDRNTAVATALMGVEKWIGQTLYPMWNDINNLVMRKLILSKEEYNERLQDLKSTYNFPDNFLQAIRFLKPTEKQLRLLREEEEFTEQPSIQNLMKLDNMIYNYEVRKEHVKENIAILRNQIEEKRGNTDTLIELLTWIQAGQLFDFSKEADKKDNISQGYNISGTPGTAITYHFDKEGHLIMNVGWVLSTKGLSELWLGTILKRKERRDR